MALLMPTAPMAAGLRRPTIMVSTIDMAIQPSSERTTGMASSNSAANSPRKRVLGVDCVAGERESMCLVHLNRSGSGIRGGRVWGESLLRKIQDGKVIKAGLRGAAIALLTDRERWPSGLRRTLGKRVYRKVPWVRIPLSPPS